MSNALSDFQAFLTQTLPPDYLQNPRKYRFDESLRREFQIASFENGWLIPEWPQGLGGRNLELPDSIAVKVEGAKQQVPRQMNIQGTGVVAPALRTFGTSEQLDKYLVPTLRGDHWWGLGMSEPGAGSDLASLRTTAVRDGDEFVLNGQKIWTTQADEAAWCMMFVRTDPEAPKHRGISCLLVDMDTPGIDVRPIGMADGILETFCEVFLDDVRVPASTLLGDLNGGWKVAMSGLEHERDMIWIHNWLEMQRALTPLTSLPDLTESTLDSLGRLLADMEAIRLVGYTSVAYRNADIDTPVANILKLFGSEAVQRASALTLELLGDNADWSYEAFQEYLESLAATLYGGTSEVQRNIIGERILGLPKGA